MVSSNFQTKKPARTAVSLLPCNDIGHNGKLITRISLLVITVENCPEISGGGVKKAAYREMTKFIL